MKYIYKIKNIIIITKILKFKKRATARTKDHFREIVTHYAISIANKTISKEKFYFLNLF